MWINQVMWISGLGTLYAYGRKYVKIIISLLMKEVT